jgi:hypothetical protein
MANARPCSSASPPRRRRTAAWREYQIDHSELHSCAPSSSAWPEIPAHAAPISNAPDPTSSGGKFSSQANLADRLDVSIATLARARKRGRLVGHLIGGQWRFTEQQIANYLKLTEPPLRLYGSRSNENDPL